VSRGRAATAATIIALCAPPAWGADLAPGPAAIGAAARAGLADAAARQGYPLRAHVLYEVRDARAADPADGAVDAVVLATPLERTRHAAYIAAYSGRTLTPAEAYAEAGLPPGHLAVIVFAHGADEDDAAFAAGFSAATLLVAGAAAQTAEPAPSETSEAVYPLAARNRSRQVATITYRFDLSAVPGAGARRAWLFFRDATGKAFDLPVDLGRFQ
jgi:hypothetical protein